MKKIQNITGMNDILPADIATWTWIENCFRSIAANYGYTEIRTPILELTELFIHSIGEITDIVEKEMYVFADRDGTSLCLRPEGTASCVRACLQHDLLRHQSPQRLWYWGPMFRHERPQKGRSRQFHQFGIEAFGFAGPDIDAELIFLSHRLWQMLGISDHVTLQINSLGGKASRQRYRQQLVDYLQQHQTKLDEDSQRRLQRNPLRILDSKNPDMQTIIQQAPNMMDYLDDTEQQHFSQFCQLLDLAGIPYTVNPRLVRGLDYYEKTVFEWVTNSLGAQGTLCAGGRYDGLIVVHGGEPTPAVGFAMGEERLALLVEQCAAARVPKQPPHAYLIVMGQVAEQQSVWIAEQIRQCRSDLRLITHCGGGSFKSQFRRADKSEALIAIIVGDDELKSGCYTIKYLRQQREQQTVNVTELSEILTRLGEP